MTLSIMLAQVFGLYFLIMSLAMLARPHRFRLMMADLVNSPGAMNISMMLGLIVGILVVVNHNVWVMSWPVFITLIGWLTLLKAVTFLFFPDAIKGTVEWMENKKVYLGSAGVTFLLSLLFLCKGFYSG